MSFKVLSSNITKKPHMPFNLPSHLLAAIRAPREESRLAVFSSLCLIHCLVQLGDLLPGLPWNHSYCGSPMTPKCCIYLFPSPVTGIVHSLLNTTSFFLLLGFYDRSSLEFFLLLWASLLHFLYSLSSFAEVLMLANPRFHPWPASLPTIHVLSRYTSTVTYLNAEEFSICISSLGLSSEFWILTSNCT